MNFPSFTLYCYVMGLLCKFRVSVNPPSSHCSDCIAVILRDLGRLERESLQKLAEVAKEGFLLKQQLIHEAKKGQEEKQVRKAKPRSCSLRAQDFHRLV